MHFRFHSWHLWDFYTLQNIFVCAFLSFCFYIYPRKASLIFLHTLALPSPPDLLWGYHQLAPAFQATASQDPAANLSCDNNFYPPDRWPAAGGAGAGMWSSMLLIWALQFWHWYCDECTICEKYLASASSGWERSLKLPGEIKIFARVIHHTKSRREGTSIVGNFSQYCVLITLLMSRLKNLAQYFFINWATWKMRISSASHDQV